MKVRITRAPAEREIDGIKLDRFTPGSVREVTAPIGSWLIAEGYAEPEMRACERDDAQFYSTDPIEPFVAVDRRKRGR